MSTHTTWQYIKRNSEYKPIRHVMLAGALSRVKPNPRAVPLNEL